MLIKSNVAVLVIIIEMSTINAYHVLIINNMIIWLITAYVRIIIIKILMEIVYHV